MVAMEKEDRGKRKNSMDMLQGPLLGKIFFFALPLAISAVLQQLFNAADVAVVGRFASPDAMAAVGSNAPVIGLLVNLFLGLSVGANVVIANLIGAGQKDRIRDAVHTILALAILMGFILTVFGIAISPAVLGLMGAPEEVMNLSVLYLRVYFLGMPMVLLYNYGAAILRSKGDSRRPLFALALSGVINIGLNLLFVIVFHLHVAGVALATVLSNAVGASLILYFLATEEETFRFSFRRLRIRKVYLSYVLRIGLPAGVQGMVFSFSNVVIQSAINSFGAACIAGSTAAQNFEFISYCFLNAFAQTAVTFTSQNYGAGKKDRCKKVFQLTMLLGIGFDILMIAVFILFRRQLILLFTTDPVVIEYAMDRMMCVCLTHALIGTYEISGGCIRGMNRSLVPALISIFGTCAFRLIYVFTVLPQHHTFGTLMNVYPISWILTGTLMITAYFIIRRKAFMLLKSDAK